jgi:hypothetical protein
VTVVLLALRRARELDLRFESFPIAPESELRRLINGGAEVEILCTKAPDPASYTKGEWLYLVRWGEDAQLVLCNSKRELRYFHRVTGVATYGGHTLELAQVSIPFVEGQFCAGMYHRDRQPPEAKPAD